MTSEIQNSNVNPPPYLTPPKENIFPDNTPHLIITLLIEKIITSFSNKCAPLEKKEIQDWNDAITSLTHLRRCCRTLLKYVDKNSLYSSLRSFFCMHAEYRQRFSERNVLHVLVAKENNAFLTCYFFALFRKMLPTDTSSTTASHQVISRTFPLDTSCVHSRLESHSEGNFQGTYLTWAIRMNNIYMALLCFKHHADVNQQEREGGTPAQTPLQIASAIGNKMMVQLCLNQPNINVDLVFDQATPSALEHAILHDHPLVAQLLLQNKTSPLGNRHNPRAMSYAIQVHSLPLVQLLFARGHPVDAPEEDRTRTQYYFRYDHFLDGPCNPLRDAIQCGSVPIVTYLVKQQAALMTDPHLNLAADCLSQDAKNILRDFKSHYLMGFRMTMRNHLEKQLCLLPKEQRNTFSSGSTPLAGFSMKVELCRKTVLFEERECLMTSGEKDCSLLSQKTFQNQFHLNDTMLISQEVEGQLLLAYKKARQAIMAFLDVEHTALLKRSDSVRNAPL